MDRWVGWLMDGWMDGWMGWMGGMGWVGWMDGWVGGLMDGWIGDWVSKMKAGDCNKQQSSLPPAQMYRKGQPVMDGWTGG